MSTFKNSSLDNRSICPCCGYPTIIEEDFCDICRLCDWEEDGLGGFRADEVIGGPNADYSLTEARQNFLVYRTMNEPTRDRRATGPDTKYVWEIKGQLITAFENLNSDDCDPIVLLDEIIRLEKILDEEHERRLVELGFISQT